MTTQVTVRDDLAVSVGPNVVAHLEADEALDFAAQLARGAVRRIATEDGADAIFDDDTSDSNER